MRTEAMLLRIKLYKQNGRISDLQVMIGIAEEQPIDGCLRRYEVIGMSDGAADK